MLELDGLGQSLHLSVPQFPHLQKGVMILVPPPQISMKIKWVPASKACKTVSGSGSGCRSPQQQSVPILRMKNQG